MGIVPSIAIPIISLLVALTLSLIITRVAAMALMLTGLSRESARFQARSAFTGVGFTTSESEAMVKHPVRRHIVMTLMLLGNVGIATVIATLMATFMIALLDVQKDESGTDWAVGLGLLVVGLLLLWAAAKSRWVENRLNRIIAHTLQNFTHLEVRDYVSLLKLASGFAVFEMRVEPQDWVANKTLVELALAREGMLVLGILRDDGKYLGAPSGDSRIAAADTLVIYGPLDRLRELDTRKRGPVGDLAHEEAANDYAEYLAEVRQEDETTVGATE